MIVGKIVGVTTSLSAAAVAVIQAMQPVPNPTLEVFKVIMLTLTTAGVMWTAKTVFVNRDDVREMKMKIGDPKEGLIHKVDLLYNEVERVKAWRTTIEAVEAAERDLYEGEERRHRLRRTRDILNEAHRTDEHSID